MRRARWRGIVLAAALCAAALPLSAQSGRSWRPGDRVLVTRFAEVGAVAADLRTLYAASVLGIERWDYAARRWLPPITALDGYPTSERPTALAVDQASYSLWLGTANGGLYAYDLSFGRWNRVPLMAAGEVATLVPSPQGLWVLAGATWFLVRPSSSFADPVPPGQVPANVRAQTGSPLERAARADPFLASTVGSLGVGDRLQRWPVTSAAPGDRPGVWWLGTWGGNVLRFEGHTGNSERLDFGLVSPGVSALAADGRDLWFGGDGRSRESGVTRASADLGRWQSWDAREAGAPDGAVQAILPTPEAVWFGAADGLYRLDRRSQRFSRLDERDRLPSDHVMALAPAADGIWAGTRDGLALVDAGGSVRGRILAGRPVRGLSLVADTLWVASDQGLLLIPDVSRALAAPTGADSGAGRSDTVHLQPIAAAPGVAGLSGRVLAATSAAGQAWAITEDGVWRRDPAAGWAPARDATLVGIGRPLALAADRGGLWVAGAAGIAHYDASSRAWRSYTVGPDLPPGPVTAILPLGDVVWAAGPAGAVRLPLRI